MNKLVKIDDSNHQISIPNQILDMKRAVQALKDTSHYRKLGEGGVLSVLLMAQSLKIDPMQALNGDLFPVNGHVEMRGKLMMSLIRQAGHSIRKDPKSTDNLCILHGKRCDNGDEWTESFGIEDAKKAGLLSNGTYSKYGKIMFQWRALSNLARFLFADVIKGCYIEGEIKDSIPMEQPVDVELEDQYSKKILDIKPEKIECSTENFESFVEAWSQTYSREEIMDYIHCKSEYLSKKEEREVTYRETVEGLIQDQEGFEKSFLARLEKKKKEHHKEENNEE